MTNHALDFYKQNSHRYSQLSHEYTHSVYTNSSHDALRGDMDLLNHLVGLTPGKHCLDAGCGAGARDVHLLWSKGYDVYGIDAVEENIELARKTHPEIARRVQIADLQESLPFARDSFDIVMCNAVIQHISPPITETVTLPELGRVLKPGGVLQLMFKVGSGMQTVVDRAYGDDGISRSFQLYEEQRVLDILGSLHCHLIAAEKEGELGGLMYFDDPKPMRHCVFWVRKD
jgi:ubiquinone/menaquinone biosynthesis C-methylase UbiE